MTRKGVWEDLICFYLNFFFFFFSSRRRHTRLQGDWRSDVCSSDLTQPGGRVVTLEITRPTLPVFSLVFGLYFHRLAPALGAAVAGDRQAYRYLPDSVERFVTPDELVARMRGAGLRSASYQRLGLGTIAVHTAIA